MKTHRCAAVGCKTTVSENLLMCSKHWRMIPRQIRKEIVRAIGKGTIGQYLDAVYRAQDAISERIVDCVMRDLPEEAR